MSLLVRAARHVRGETRGAHPWEMGNWPVWGPTASGVTPTPETALGLAAVYGSIRVRAGVSGSLPVRAVDSKGVGVPRPAWLDTPNPEISWSEVVEQVVTSVDHRGNAYVVPTLLRGQVVELWVLDPDQVSVYRDHETRQKRFRVAGQEVDPRTTPIIHIPGLMRGGALTGMAVLDAARELIGSALASEESASRFFASGGTMRGVIEAPREMGNEAVSAMTAGFNRTYAGVSNSHKVGALTGGATYKPLSVTPDQQQLLETRELTAKTIAGSLFGVPPLLLGHDSKTALNSGLEAIAVQFVQFGLLPTLVKIERHLSPLMPGDQGVRFDLNGLMRGSYVDRMNGYRVGRETGVLTANDVRVLENLVASDQPGADELHRPMNWEPLGATAEENRDED